MQYYILTGATPELLQKSVNDFIKAGWQPQGGAFSYLSEVMKNTYFAQAMIKIK